MAHLEPIEGLTRLFPPLAGIAPGFGFTSGDLDLRAVQLAWKPVGLDRKLLTTSGGHLIFADSSEDGSYSAFPIISRRYAGTCDEDDDGLSSDQGQAYALAYERLRDHLSGNGSYDERSTYRGLRMYDMPELSELFMDETGADVDSSDYHDEDGDFCPHEWNSAVLAWAADNINEVDNGPRILEASPMADGMVKEGFSLRKVCEIVHGIAALALGDLPPFSAGSYFCPAYSIPHGRDISLLVQPSYCKRTGQAILLTGPALNCYPDHRVCWGQNAAPASNEGPAFIINTLERSPGNLDLTHYRELLAYITVLACAHSPSWMEMALANRDMASNALLSVAVGLLRWDDRSPNEGGPHRGQRGLPVGLFRELVGGSFLDHIAFHNRQEAYDAIDPSVDTAAPTMASATQINLTSLKNRLTASLAKARWTVLPCPAADVQPCPDAVLLACPQSAAWLNLAALGLARPPSAGGLANEFSRVLLSTCPPPEDDHPSTFPLYTTSPDATDRQWIIGINTANPLGCSCTFFGQL